MKKTFFPPAIIITICFLYFYGAPVHACRYTVREIGFSDLGTKPYHLYFFTSDTQPVERTETIRNICRAALSDANVRVSIVNIKDRNHHAMELAQFWQVDPMKHAILSSPQGQSIVLPLDQGGESFKEAVWSVLERAVSSPMRQKIRKSIVARYGIVLLVEGTNTEANQQAVANIEKAIKEIGRIMVQMPKPIKEPPVLLELSPQQRKEEKVLLWSLGIDPADTTEPVMAILYGRGRKMGPLVRGKQISENTMFNLLNLIGADCECGLDRAWMLGMMIPLRWDARMQRAVVDQLGFDAENPMIRAEMAQILSLGLSSPDNEAGASGSAVESASGYNEGIIDFKSDIEIPRVPMSQIQENNSQNLFSSFRKTIYILVAVTLFILFVGAFLLLKAKRHKY